ncbi:DUF6151 family protein [Ramlibacter sp.]|uniref:DUF6151 family protein n=1 Tax=Ramlibacter sp. TaxID=1917967 RepID=UPI00261F8541|nr:DUF6151 family protein [Ramlibacter sp.]MDB5954771.1 hypothetical protein [Ramlibacter sp.]
MTHRIQCTCGQVRGEIVQPRRAMRAVCYCRDCQTYAHLLRRADQVLDAAGGTDVIATPASNLAITAGREHLACVSLSPRGLLRWYAACCDTPVANTPRDWKLPYVGLVHTCLRQPDPLERSFPQVEIRIYTKSAHGAVPADTALPGKLHFLRMVMRLTGMRLTGAYKSTPLFSASGEPVAAPRVAGTEEIEAARRAATA